jgi:23S rRNA (guanosine2251-2'-O)-methyltransferase
VTHLPPAALKRITQVASHQGVALELAAVGTLKMEDLEPLLEEPGLLLYLDRIQDPQNLGAILRSALAFGVRAVMIPARKAAGLTNTVVKVSQGAALKIPVVRIDHPQSLFKMLQARGFWLYGLDGNGTVSLSEATFPERTVLLLGSEGTGLSTTIKNLCDTLVAIPMPGGFESLNVSVSTAIVLYEYSRQRIEVK